MNEPDFSGVHLAEVPRAQRAIEKAAQICEGAAASRSPEAQAEVDKRAAMVADDIGRRVLSTLIDRSFRSNDPHVVAEQFAHILREHGVPEFLGIKDKLLMTLFQYFGPLTAPLSVPLLKRKLRQKTEKVLLSGEEDKLADHIAQRIANCILLNINNLGEVILSEAEAQQKTEDDVRLLRRADVECISVKDSNLYSQSTPRAHRHSVHMIANRLRPRLRAARDNQRVSYNPEKAFEWDRGSKLVNLDMEAYGDLRMTVDAFKKVLNEPEFLDLQAGIALQAYIPDSYEVLQELIEWSHVRVAKGGAPIRVRVVKGANRAMEQIESSTKRWPLATYREKVDSDANWKRMAALIAENIDVCHLGIASHNLFDIAWAVDLLEEMNIDKRCYFIEMLEGMVNDFHQQIQQECGRILLYAPAVTQQKFLSAIAYLMRRFDEQSDRDNFLSKLDGLEVGSEDWVRLRDNFIESLRRMETVRSEPFRNQDRLAEEEPGAIEPQIIDLCDYRPEPDTDWTRPKNQAWLRKIRHGLVEFREAARADAVPTSPLRIGAREVTGEREHKDVYDRMHRRLKIGRVALANKNDIEASITAALNATEWTQMEAAERDGILAKVTVNLQQRRGRLMKIAGSETGKSHGQSDGEVSEAVDFSRLYPAAVRDFRRQFGDCFTIEPKGNGVVAVIAPWNFPIAIAAGGVLAALAAGNRVILKPSPHSILTAYELAQCFWDAGVPREALQVIPCTDEVADSLVQDPRLETAIFTGGTATADHIIQTNPRLSLHAETGGKNVSVVLDDADREAAIQDVIESAFGADGQKCSATSILAVTDDVYNDATFMRQLVEAARSRCVGSQWNPRNTITPLAMEMNPRLRRAVDASDEELDDGGEWVLKPRRVSDRDDFISPGIRKGVRRGSWMARTELFGPVLCIVRIKDADEAVELINETGYGLTLGVHSLDDRKVSSIVERARVGVIYVRGKTTGAIAGIQGFQGWEKSRRGRGVQAGWLNYVLNFLDIKEKPGARQEEYRLDGKHTNKLATKDAKMLADMLGRMERCDSGDQAQEVKRGILLARNYLYSMVQHFNEDQFPTENVRGQENRHRYRSIGTSMLRLTENMPLSEMIALVSASIFAGNRTIISVPRDDDLSNHPKFSLLYDLFDPLINENTVQFLGQTDEHVARAIAAGGINQVRYSGRNEVPQCVYAAAAEHPHVYLNREQLVADGRIELLKHVQEQTISDQYHRYGGGLREKDAA